MKKNAKLIPVSKAKTAYALLSEIAALALEEPERIAMRIVHSSGDSLERLIQESARIKKIPSCGTVGCIAGWALVQRGELRAEGPWSQLDRAADMLGLSSHQREDFFCDDTLMDACNQQTLTHAKNVVKHIRAFQRKHAKQLKAKTLAPLPVK